MLIGSRYLWLCVYLVNPFLATGALFEGISSLISPIFKIPLKSPDFRGILVEAERNNTHAEANAPACVKVIAFIAGLIIGEVHISQSDDVYRRA